MKKIYFGIFALLLVIAAVIAPVTYNAAKNKFAGPQTQSIDTIDHSAHHGGTSNTQ